MVAWHSEENWEQDIKAQVFDKNGIKIGTDLLRIPIPPVM